MKTITMLLSLLLLLFIVKTPVVAQEATVAAKPVSVEYTLPYPGILPDHPLYIVKQIRDWVMDKLIMDPVKKAEFYLLQADKRLAMGMMLSTSGKPALSEVTISKGEKYMHSAVQSLLVANAAGQSVPGYIVDRIKTSLMKHEEVIKAELAKAAEAQKAGLTESLTLVTQLARDLALVK